MVVPVDREGKVVDSTLLRRDSAIPASLEAAGNTRKAGGRTQDRGPQTVGVNLKCPHTHTHTHTLFSEYVIYTHLHCMLPPPHHI